MYCYNYIFLRKFHAYYYDNHAASYIMAVIFYIATYIILSINSDSVLFIVCTESYTLKCTTILLSMACTCATLQPSSWACQMIRYTSIVSVQLLAMLHILVRVAFTVMVSGQLPWNT